MLRCMFMFILVGIVSVSGCGIGVPMACSDMTLEEYTEARKGIKVYVEFFRSMGMSKADFLDMVLPSDCHDSGAQQTPYGTMTCSCSVALYTDAANEVW